jgi:ParB-like chromosome segregation protein Spo0J
MKIRDLPVHELILDPRLNLRDKLDQDTVERYMEAWDRLPPVTVYRVDGQLLLADGIHRHAAAVTLGRRTIKAEIVDGTFDEALDYVAGANLHHGLPLTRAERRRAIELKLRLHHERSDRHLAEELCVGRELVAKIRRQLIESSQIPMGEVRVGSDGKRYPAVSLGKDPDEKRPRTYEDAGGESGPRAGREREPAWQESPPAKGERGRIKPPWDEGSPDARSLAQAPPIAPSAPTIDEMLQLMARQVIEVVGWTNAEGFVDGYRVASANARGLFQSAVIKLAARADQLRKVS